jgi:hypothetical protein
MNDVHLHLIMNHFPIVGTFFAAALMLYALIRKDRKIALAGLVMMAVSGLLIIPVFLSGEGAEEVAEQIGLSHDVIHEHEEIAEFALWIVLLGAALSLVLIYFQTKAQELRAWIAGVGLLVSLGCFALMGQVGNTGGLIRHPEIESVEAAQKVLKEMKAGESSHQSDEAKPDESHSEGEYDDD